MPFPSLKIRVLLSVLLVAAASTATANTLRAELQRCAKAGGTVADYISCQSDATEAADKQRQRAIHQLMAQWPSQDRSAFVQAWNRFEDFLEDRVVLERWEPGSDVDIGLEEDDQEEIFLSAVRAFEVDHFPVVPVARAEALEQELNTAYAKAQRKAKAGLLGELRENELRKTQAAWLAYRDSWVAFGKLHYPAVPSYAWQAHLNEKRIDMLQALLRRHPTRSNHLKE